MTPPLPREIVRLIVTFAMTAAAAAGATDDHDGRGVITLPCLTTGGGLRGAGINTACLLLDRDLYHTARRALFGPANEFVVGRLASWMIPTLAGSYGALGACIRERCAPCGTSPVLSRVVFVLGDAEDPALGRVRMDAFMGVLGSMRRRRLSVEELTVRMESYSFRSETQMLDFCRALDQGVEVGKGLVVQGLDVHLELDVRALPAFTRMMLQPVEWSVAFRTDDWRQLGSFQIMYRKAKGAAAEGKIGASELGCLYHLLQRAQDMEEIAMTGHLGEEVWIEDPSSEYAEWLKNAPPDWITNGLDYVTEHTLEI